MTSNEQGKDYRLQKKSLYTVDDYIKTYIDPKKIAQATAIATKTSVKEVEESMNFVFKNLKYWLDNPSIKAEYYFVNNVSFRINPNKVYRELQKQIAIFRKLKEEGREPLPYALKKFNALRKRHGLARVYDKIRRDRGYALNEKKIKEKQAKELARKNKN